MTTDDRVTQGTPAWFEMVGTVMSDAATNAALPPDKDVSLVERYTDAAAWGDGLVQGFRFDLIGGKPSFRVGVRADERGDINVEVKSEVARALNQMPAEAANVARKKYIEAGDLHEEGDLSRLGEWFPTTQQRIINRTK